MSEVFGPAREHAALNKSVSLKVKNVTLLDIAQQLAQQVGFSIDLKKSAEVGRDLRRSFKEVTVEKASFHEAMEKLLSPLNLTYRLEAGSVVLYKKTE